MRSQYFLSLRERTKLRAGSRRVSLTAHAVRMFPYRIALPRLVTPFILIGCMEELINLVVKETGISQEDARKAVQVVLDQLKSRLPGPIASHLDSFVSGGLSGGTSAIVEEASSVLKGKLGGLFGGS